MNQECGVLPEIKSKGNNFGYFFHTNAIEPCFCINLRNTSKDLTGLTNLGKNQNMKFFDNSDITS